MREKIALQHIVKRNPEIVTSNIDGEIVMMSIDNGEYYGLDEIASRIWELIEKPISVNSLIEALMDEFEVNKPDCANDTLEFLSEMANKGLIIVE
jgi:hypothetical protein